MQDDDRVLTDADWELYRTGVELLRRRIENDLRDRADSTLAVAAFDHLTAEQKLALLAERTYALRDPRALPSSW